MRKRFLLSSLVACAGLVALGAAAIAAGGGGIGTPGSYTFKDVNAGAYLTDSSNGFIFISVDRGIQTFKIRGVTGPPSMVGPETVLDYSGNDAAGNYVAGCFIIPDSTFAVAQGLGTATLIVDPTQETPCPGALIAADAGGRPGLAGPAPEAGGGGGGGGTPITVNLTWTSSGAITYSQIAIDSRCENASSHANAKAASTPASVSGSVSLLTDVTSLFASISEDDTDQVITNTFSSACTGF